MKEVRKYNRNYILLSALYVALGIVMLAWPSASIKMIGYVLGFALIVLGVTYGIIYFTRDNLEHFLQMDLVIGIVCLAFGVFLLFNQTFLGTVLPIAMGIILLLGAVVKIQSAINMKKLRYQKWHLVLVSALIIIGLAIVLLCNIIKQERTLIVYIGICLVFDGITNIISMVCIMIRVRSMMRQEVTYPDPHHEVLHDHKTNDRGAVMPYHEEKMFPKKRE